MSSSIEIHTSFDNTLEVIVRANMVELEILNHEYDTGGTIRFLMSIKEDREAIRNLIQILQHQLEVHEGLND